jgi:hypothetical protein
MTNQHQTPNSTVRVVSDQSGTLFSIQTWTESHPHRPFPAWEEIAEVSASSVGLPVLRLSERARQIANVTEKKARRLNK